MALAEGGPGLAGPTGARAKLGSDHSALDPPDGLRLKVEMHPSARAPVETQLAVLARRLAELDGELAEQAEALAARSALGLPPDARLLARHERQRESFWAVKRRVAELQSRMPTAPPPADDDF